MFDVRTAADVLATGTYSMFPNLNVRALLPPKPTDEENEAETGRHLDFLIRSQLLNTKVPSVFTNVEISGGKLTLTCEAEFELVLSPKLELPGRPWKVEKIRILIKAENTDEPTTDTLVRARHLFAIHHLVIPYRLPFYIEKTAHMQKLA
jgi:hypothetical protein